MSTAAKKKKCRACGKKDATHASKEDGKVVLVCSQICSDSYWTADRLRPHRELIKSLFQDGFRVVASGHCEKKKMRQGSSPRVSEDVCGEDALFISHESLMLGVFDGVGGYGGTSGFLARCLAENIRAQANRLVSSRLHTQLYDDYAVDRPADLLKDMLDNAERRCLATKMPTGGSTAVYCVINPRDRMIWVLNLGDSKGIVVRDGEIMLKTRQQEHKSGAPYQLTNRSNVDDPDNSLRADIFTFGPLKAGDLLVFASDGLWDNLEDDEVASELKRMDKQRTSKFRDAHRNTSEMCEELVRMARSTKRKNDDITVVIGRVYELTEGDSDFR